MPNTARTVSLTALTAIALLGAGGLIALNRAPATVASSTEVSTAVLPEFPAEAVGTYATDNVHSSVIFKTTHAGVANFYGRFNSIDGTFVLAENPAESTFNFTIQTESVDTGNQGRDDHLRNPDFFNVRQFPTATFVSTGIVAADEGPHTLNGNFTLNGVTRPISAALEFTGTGTFRNNQVAGFEAIFTIKRSDFGITTYLGAIGDEVTVIVAVEGRKQG